MGGQAVLDQGDLLAVEQLVGGGEELDQRVVVGAPRRIPKMSWASLPSGL